jgi:hypothetical protein
MLQQGGMVARHAGSPHISVSTVPAATRVASPSFRAMAGVVMSNTAYRMSASALIVAARDCRRLLADVLATIEPRCIRLGAVRRVTST